MSRPLSVRFTPSHLGLAAFDCIEFDLSDDPTSGPVDLDYVEVTLVGEDGVARPTRLAHGARLAPGQAVLPGLITMHHRDGDREEAASFGAKVSARPAQGYTTFTITSAAPLFYIDENLHAATHLIVDELLANLARARARYRGNEMAYTGDLLRLPPMTLFVGSLQTLWIHLHGRPAMYRSLDEQRALSAVGSVITVLKNCGQWPANPRPMEDLLAGRK